jgi:hypothetical protein
LHSHRRAPHHRLALLTLRAQACASPWRSGRDHDPASHAWRW